MSPENNNHWQDLVRQAEKRRTKWEEGIVRIPGVTLQTLSPDRLGEFEHGRLYEFLPYRQDPGGEILFECEKEGGKAYFEERFRIYRPQDIRGIERREDPSYRDGLARALYLRTPEDCSILDMGCGSAKYLLPVNPTGRRVLAFDLSREIIEENRRWKGLERITFFAGDCLGLDLFPTREFDFVSAVNLLNVLSPENVRRVLEESHRIARRGVLLGFTLPSQSDLWTPMTPEVDRALSQGSSAASPEEIQDLFARRSFLGQMNLFLFLREFCRRRKWSLRIFRFLDRTLWARSHFPDARMLYPEENAVLKFLELPSRKISRVEEVSDEEVEVYSLGYGVEIFFSEKERLPPGDALFYFSEGEDFSKLSLEGEMDSAIDFWKLPFPK